MRLKASTSLFIALCTISLTSFAQGGKYGATPEDSNLCVRNLSVYVDFVNAKDYKGAYKHWKVPIIICPEASLKMYVDGVNILRDLIDDEKDAKRKKQLIDTLLFVHDQRIKYFNKEGYVLGRKGYFMYKYGTGVEEAFNTMNRSVELQGNESEPATLIYYFMSAVDLEEKTKKTKEEVLDLFTKCMDIVDYNIQNAKNEKEAGSYTKAQEYIEAKASPYLTCPAIESIVTKKFEANKEDDVWLAKMARLMEKKECAESTVFFKVANKLHELKPSDESAKNLGILSLSKKKYAEAEKFFKQAIELIGDKDNDKKADYEYYLAKTYYAQSQYSAARQHCLNAAKLRPGWGEPFIMIGDMYAASYNICDGKDKELKAVYWVAVDKYAYAKSIDESLTEEANKKIAAYSQQFPAVNDAFFHQVTKGDSYTVGCWINETTIARVK